MIDHLLAACEFLATALPGIVQAQTHRGRFAVEELASGAGLRTPSLRVAFLGADRITETPEGQLDVDGEWVAYIITADRRGDPREDQGLRLAKDAALAIKDWCRPGAAPPRNLLIQNLWSGQADNQALMIMAVVWDQTVRVGTSVYADHHGWPPVTDPLQDNIADYPDGMPVGAAVAPPMQPPDPDRSLLLAELPPLPPLPVEG